MALLRRKSQASAGMTMLEMLVSVLILVMFFGIFVAVLEVSFRFAAEVEPAFEPGSKSESGQSKGVLIDHQEIQQEFDELVMVLSQPGIAKLRFDGYVTGARQIAFSPTTDPDKACAPADSNPLQYWGLPGPSLKFPDGYRICVWKTGLVESSPYALARDQGQGNAYPGIYILQALPERADAARLPTRRVFCRPRPYC